MDKETLENLVAKFIKFLHEKYNYIEVEGILVFGSVLNKSCFGKHSDVDIYILIKNNGKRYRGVQLIDGVEFDYFVNPIEQLKFDIENAGKNSSTKMTILYMLESGKIFQDEKSELLEMKNKAKEILKKKTEVEMQNWQKKVAVYFIGSRVL